MAQIDPNTVQWDAPPQPVGKPVTGAANEPLQGGVILPGKPKEVPQPSPLRETEKWRTMTPQEVAATPGLDPTKTYQINAAGKIEPIGGAAGAPKVEPKTAAANLLLSAGVDPTTGLDPVSALIEGSTSGAVENWFANAYGAVTGEATPGMENIAKLKTIVSDMTLQLTGGSLGAGVSNADVTFLKERVGNLADPTRPANERLAAWNEVKNRLQRVTGATPPAPAPAAGGGAPPPGVAPIEAGKPFQTEADLAAQRQLQDAWNRGLSVDDMIALNQQMGRGPFSPEDISRMRDARAKGGPISFYATPTGQPTAAQGIIGAALETPVGEAVGGYAMGAANALTAGTLDELAPILGLDPARVQAAKDYLRERAPTASLAGEVTGGILGSIPAVRGAGAALAGTRLAGAAPLIGEATYGAAYGAGEAPEGQRALGALIGGGVAGIGGALANRFLPGGPGTFTGMAPEVPAGAVIPEVPPVAAMAPETPPVAAAAPSPAPVAPAAAAPAPAPEMAAELGTIIREASGAGAKAKGAQIKLAEMAQINPDAKAAAERLGIEVPADVFSDNPQVRAAIGLTRSLAGGEAEAAWRTAVSNAVDQADNIMRDFDAQFVEGAVSPGTVSQRVKDSLTKTRSDLNAEASAIYKRVDESVPKQTPVQMDNLFRELTAIAGEVGESGMTAQEKRLMGLIQSGEAGGGDITYGRLIREKNLIGKALKREESPYGSLDEATLKRLYAALASDQLDNVGRIGGEELRAELRGANLIYAKERALGERIVNAFGRDLEGGIANKMRAAITGAAKGDPGEFARLMKAVPADLRREVVATALTAAARSARGAEKGGFGFSEFADLYPKLRANPQVYKQIVETLGPKAADTLRDLYQVSKRITDARANVLTTGKANQALVESLNAEGILARIMGSTTAKRAVGAMAGLGGPITGAVMPDIMQAMSKGNPDAVRAAGKMFASPEFQAVLTEAATQPEVTERAINRAVSSQRFRDFAKTIGLELKQGRNWLRSTITAGAVQEMGPEAGQPEGAIMVGPQQ